MKALRLPEAALHEHAPSVRARAVALYVSREALVGERDPRSLARRVDVEPYRATVPLLLVGDEVEVAAGDQPRDAMGRLEVRNAETAVVETWDDVDELIAD
jgi:hypothetical protein